MSFLKINAVITLKRKILLEIYQWLLEHTLYNRATWSYALQWDGIWLKF